MCSTILGSGFLGSGLCPAAVHAADRPPAAKLRQVTLRQVTPSVVKRAASSHAADLQRDLAGALRQGELALLARVFETTYGAPKLRDDVLRQVQGQIQGQDLSPRLLREVTTAADLGVLTSGQPLRLAPNAGSVLATRAATLSDAPSGQNVALANNTSPNLPSPLPSAAAQTWNLDLIQAQAAYARGFTGAGVTVTVGDTGFDLTNAALTGQFITAKGYNYVVVNGGTYVTTELTPETVNDLHGSHVSGIIAAKKFDNVDMHGVAYDAKIIPLRVIADGDYNYTVAVKDDPSALALNYFATQQGTKVYNASYGPNYDKSPNLTQWPVFDVSEEANAALNALKADKIIVAANGNDRIKSPVAAANPSGLALLPFLNPAHAGLGVYSDPLNQDWTSLQNQKGQIIAVMSIASDKTAANYSNLCGVTASWCVAAPGGQMSNNGLGVYSTVPDNTYEALQGTSMAAPAVSGALAVLIQANPSYNAQDLSHLLFSTTEDLGQAGIDTVFGQGLIRLDRATDGPTTLGAGAIVNVAADTTTYWSQALATSGDFTKTGDGILTVSGRTNAGGNVAADLGTLAVDGTLTMAGGSRLNVAQPATLAGFGTIVGDTVIAGTLSPGKMPNIGDLVANGVVAAGTVLNGNSVGSLTFNGNVTLTSTATTRIDIDGNRIVPGGPGTYDKIYVTGAGHVFSAAGTLTPVLRGSVGTVSNYTPTIGTEFAFVQALNGAGITGSFATLVQPTAGLPANGRFDMRYSATAITLRVTPVSFAGLASTDRLSTTTRAVAGILDSDRAASGVMPSRTSKALYDGLYDLDTETDYEKALTQLGAPGQPAMSGASLQAFTGFLGALGDRQDALALGAEQGQNGTAQGFALSYAGRGVMSAETSAAMNAFASLAPAERIQNGWSVWGQGFGRSSKVGDSGDLAGSKSVSAGFTVGADRRFSNSFVAGAAFGYARTTSTTTDASGTSDTYAGAAYASWTPGAAVIDARIAAGPSQMSTNRQLVMVSSGVQGRANGIGIATSLEAGYRIPLGGDWVVKPYAGIGWQGFRRDAYSENQQPFGLVYAAQTYDKLTTTAGAALSTRMRTVDGTTLMPELKLAWAHDLRDTTLVSQAALLDESFTIESARPGRDAALVGLKVSGWRSEAVRVFGAYNGEFRSNAVSHQLSAGARFAW